MIKVHPDNHQNARCYVYIYIIFTDNLVKQESK